MNKKNIFDMLENAEDDSMDILTENCPDVSDEQLEKLLAESERRYLMKKKEIEEKNTNTDIEKPEYNEDSVSGVERIKSRPAWLRPLAIAASFVLIAGTAAGSIALMHKGKADRPDKSSAAASTEAATIDHEDVDQDYIIDLCSHVTDHYDKLFIKGVFEVDVNFLENPSHVRLEKTRRYDNLKKTSEETIKATSTFDNDPDSNSVITDVSYYYNDRIVDVQPDEKNYTITDASAYPMSFYKTETSNALAYIDAHTNESILKYHMDEWSITGWDTVCGRECAVITTRSDSVESVDYIDIETGVVLKFSSDSEREHIDYEVSDVQYNDAAGDVVTPSEFKKYIADNGFVLDSSYIIKGDGTEELADHPLDLSFLDEEYGEPETASAAETNDVTTQAATEAVSETGAEKETETVPVTEAETQNVTESETTQPAEQVPDNIDKDYILDLVSNRKNNINRVYAKIKKSSENYDESGKMDNFKGDDITIQYDKDKDCFCEYVNDVVGEGHTEIDMIMYKEKWVAVRKWLNNYRIISDIGAYTVTETIGDYMDGDVSYKTLDRILANKDKWSITGRETVNGKDCAVVEYINKEYEMDGPVKSVMYIDIKTGIVMKSNAAYYPNALCKEAEAWAKSSLEITELKLNDDAPELKPSDFKKFVKDNGFEPEDEESKDLSFLDN